jgi:signal peptidase I
VYNGSNNYLPEEVKVLSDENRLPSREELEFELNEINRLLYPEQADANVEPEDPTAFKSYSGRSPAGGDEETFEEPGIQRSEPQPCDTGAAVPADERPADAAGPEHTAPGERSKANAREVPPKGRTTLSDELFGWLQAIVTSLVLIVIMFMYVVRIIGVSGISMIPTLYDKDMVVLLNASIASISPGDVIVFKQERYSDIPLVKRVIATQGQTVDIDFQTGTVYVDNAVSTYVDEPTYRSYDVTFPITVEEGKLFVMGDNRDESFDSRASTIGQIDERSVLGKVAFVVYPFSRFGDKP